MNGPRFTVLLHGPTDGFDLAPVIDMLRDDPEIQALQVGRSIAYVVAGHGSWLDFYTAGDLLSLYPRALVESFLADPATVGVVIERMERLSERHQGQPITAGPRRGAQSSEGELRQSRLDPRRDAIDRRPDIEGEIHHELD